MLPLIINQRKKDLRERNNIWNSMRLPLGLMWKMPLENVIGETTEVTCGKGRYTFN